MYVLIMYLHNFSPPTNNSVLGLNEARESVLNFRRTPKRHTAAHKTL